MRSNKRVKKAAAVVASTLSNNFHANACKFAYFDGLFLFPFFLFFFFDTFVNV